MPNVTKNYSDQGGDRTVIGGELKVPSGGKITLDSGSSVEGAGAANLAVAATESAFGGVKAAASGAGDTVECKISSADGKLYAPTYATNATASTAGLVKAAANQAAIASDATIDTLRAAFIDLILKLKTAGIMVDDA